jgi:6-methylsalicylate decarboxylase
MKNEIDHHPMGIDEVPNSTWIARRKFLASLGALGAAAVLPDALWPQSMHAAIPDRPFRIDAHHHFSAPGFIAAISARKTNQRPLEQWTPNKSIDDMDKSGVATAMISTS